MTDHSGMKLGRRPRRSGVPVAPLARYTAAEPLPAPAATADWFSRVKSWPMLGNDTVGDCTIAALGHMVQAWTTDASGVGRVMTEEQAIAAYETFGYKPGDASTDNGAVCADVLGWWEQKGAEIAGADDKLSGFASVNPIDSFTLRQAIGAFGGVYAGIRLPLSAQSQQTWSLTSGADAAPGSWGGHCVPLVGYSPAGIVCVTWGALKLMKWDWWDAYGDEAYVLLSHDFMTSHGQSPDGIAWDVLSADMRAFAAHRGIGN